MSLCKVRKAVSRERSFVRYHFARLVYKYDIFTLLDPLFSVGGENLQNSGRSFRYHLIGMEILPGGIICGAIIVLDLVKQILYNE